MAFIQLGWVSRVDEMILARERSGFAGKKVWDDIPVVTGFVGRERRLLGKYLAFGRHWEEIHVTWAHLEKKRTRLRTNTKTLQDLKSQSLETASPFIHDAVTLHLVTSSQHFLTVYGYSSVGRFDVFFRNQLLVFQLHQDESLYDSWTRFKDIIRKVPNHGLSIWTLIEIFLKHLDSLSHHIINLTAGGDLRKFSDIGAWVQVPRCMAWLDYDEHVDSLSTMDNEVGVTSPEIIPQTLPSFKEYTSPVTYPEEVEKTLGTPIEVEPLNETKQEEVVLNCNHNIPLSSKEVPTFEGPESQPLLNSPSLDVSLGDVIGPEPPIKPHSPDSSRMKVVDYLTTQTSPSPHVANSHPKGMYSYYNPGINDPKRYYGFKPSLLGKSVSLGVDISNWEMFDDDWGLVSKVVSPLGEELSLFDRPNEVKRGRILEAHSLEPIFQQ
ncbi:hypothetical protein Tco_0841702 [Tanacetum coccineum]|uniref:Uncharacterized protein n=1 Tax=Tanacetum coccineum TaxID=301880 RepID=A0ABQ5AXS8_9ASTR